MLDDRVVAPASGGVEDRDVEAQDPWVSDALARMLVRHQFVRQQGVPRLTVLAGPPQLAAARWRHFAGLIGRNVVSPGAARRGGDDAIAPFWRSPPRPAPPSPAPAAPHSPP